MSKILVVIGPSGVGKSTLFAPLRREGLVRLVPTWTTRKSRHYEDPANADHVFIDDDEFTAREQAGFFLETVQLFGLEARYGLPREALEDDGHSIRVLMLRAMLLQRLPQYFPAHIVYQVEAPRARVEAHLRARVERDGDIGSRLANFEDELLLGRHLAHRIIDNGEAPGSALAQLRDRLREDFADDRRAV
jgi:guanylate kinase